MATTRDFIAALAPICGIHPATLDKYMREIRGAGLIPSGGRGGGIGSAHLNHEHASAIILSLAAPTPGGAAAAFNAVKDLDRDNVQAGDFAGLGFTLASTIRNAARVILNGGQPYGPAETNNWELTICLAPVTVWQSWVIDGVEQREGFSDRQSALPRHAHPQDVHRGIRRQTIITSSVLNVAAELVADTMQHEEIKTKAITPAEKLAAANALRSKLEAATAERSFRLRHPYWAERIGLMANADQEADQSADKQSQPGLPVSTPENETAASPARDAAAVCDQPDKTDVVGSMQPHLKRERKFPQATVLSAGHSITQRSVIDEQDRYGGLNFAPA